MIPTTSTTLNKIKPKVRFSIPLNDLDTASNGVVGQSKNNRGTIMDVDGFTLRTVLERNGVKHIDYFSLDIEGMEKVALETLDVGEVTVETMTVEINTDSIVDYIASLGFEKHNGVLKCGKDCYWADGIFTGPGTLARKTRQENHPDLKDRPIPEELRGAIVGFIQ